MKKTGLLLYTFLVLLLTACVPKYALNKTYEISNGEWTYADSLRFEFEIADTVTLYNLLLDVKHSTEFGFQNLYTNIHTQFPNGTRLSKPLSLELADRAGIWQGDCNAKTCTIEIPIQEGAYFNQPGKYVITMEQFMRDSLVKGVQSVTLKLAEMGEQK